MLLGILMMNIWPVCKDHVQFYTLPLAVLRNFKLHPHLHPFVVKVKLEKERQYVFCTPSSPSPPANKQHRIVLGELFSRNRIKG